MGKISTYLKVGDNCKIGNKVYFLNLTFNGVFYLDIDDFSIHFVHRFSYERADAKALSSSGSMYYDNSIYFFPNNTNNILKYDILNQKEGMIEIPDQEEKNFCFAGAVWQNDTVYIFPSDLKRGIYKFYLHEQKVVRDEELSSLFEQGFPCANVFLLGDRGVLIAECGGNQIIEVDLETKKFVNRTFLDKGIQIFSMFYNQNNYWIIQNESVDIYEWNRRADILQVYKNESAVWENQRNAITSPYSNLVFLDDEILVLNIGLKKILRIHNGKKEIEDEIDFPERFRLVNSEFNGWPICNSYTILEDQVLLYPCRGNMLLIYDLKTKQLYGKEMLISDEEVPYLRQVLRERFQRREVCIERDDLATLEYFIDFIASNEKEVAILNHEHIGDSIYQYSIEKI